MTPDPSAVPIAVYLMAVEGSAGQLTTDVLAFIVAAWCVTVFLIGAGAFAAGYRRARG